MSQSVEACSEKACFALLEVVGCMVVQLLRRKHYQPPIKDTSKDDKPRKDKPRVLIIEVVLIWRAILDVQESRRSFLSWGHTYH